MSITPEQSIGRALQRATDRIALPPESRWVPERRAAVSSWSTALTAIAAALFIVVSGLAINSVRESRIITGQPDSDAFQRADDAAWAQIRAYFPPGVALRPTWIPDEFKRTGSTDCPSPQVSIWNASGTYTVSYYGTVFHVPDGRNAQVCSRVEFKTLAVRSEDELGPIWSWDYGFYGVQLVDVAPITARGTTVRVRVGPRVLDRNDLPHQLIYLNWLENGTSYELNTLDVDLTDLTRVLRSLEPTK